jgi:hypothetical protein
MDNHKLITISIFRFFKHEKDAFFFENMLGKVLGFARMQQNIFLFFEIFRRKPGILIPGLYFTV